MMMVITQVAHTREADKMDVLAVTKQRPRPRVEARRSSPPAWDRRLQLLMVMMVVMKMMMVMMVMMVMVMMVMMVMVMQC